MHLLILLFLLFVLLLSHTREAVINKANDVHKSTVLLTKKQLLNDICLQKTDSERMFKRLYADRNYMLSVFISVSQVLKYVDEKLGLNRDLNDWIKLYSHHESDMALIVNLFLSFNGKTLYDSLNDGYSLYCTSKRPEVIEIYKVIEKNLMKYNGGYRFVADRNKRLLKLTFENIENCLFSTKSKIYLNDLLNTER